MSDERTDDTRLLIRALDRQLAEALERERAALAREARLRRLLDQVEWVEPPDAHPDLGRWCPMCRSWEAYGHELRCPYYGGLVNGILADAPENPHAAVVEAARILEVEGSARRVLAAFDKERDRLTFDQWQALEALEEALYGGEE